VTLNDLERRNSPYFALALLAVCTRIANLLPVID